jgi:hypothetical protein
VEYLAVRLAAAIVEVRNVGPIPDVDLDLDPGDRASRKVIGPHRGPYGAWTDPRVRGADRAALAEVIIKATGSRQAHGYNLLDVDFHSRR